MDANMSEIKPALTREEWKAGRVWFRDRRGEVERQDPGVPVTGDCLYDSYGIELEHNTPGTRDRPLLSAFDGSWGAYLHDSTRHATAALCLYGQPFGFAREDVRRHYAAYTKASAERHAMMMATQVRAPDDGFLERVRAVEDRMAWHKSMADRIAALLPPEEP